ncbi:M23 family metallopeptidase [Streptomyces pathocidini]|uniref:M23 family metallopeptidase n=1 Tax=Streptomyces pathocidini TaxID=1650571 RepID=A0ABW7UNT4_9ACTN|nr:M23 family metallopeptidase [Streptomyces pathocidini]
MTKHTQKTSTPKATVRRRAAILAVGMGASAALGTGVAFAAAGAPAPQGGELLAVNTAAKLSQVVKAQAEGQKKAADTQVAAAKAKAAAAKRAAEKAAADRKAREAKKITPASWTTPVDKYTLGSTFGLGGSHWANKHSGQDFVVPTGTKVRAAHTGTVVTAGWGGAYGNNIVIKHGANTYTQYGHLSKLEVRVGQQVTTGQEIGKSGSTGNSTGPHLHFETRTQPVYGFAVEPLHFLRSHGVNP